MIRTALLPAFKKYGKRNFTRKILEHFDSKEKAFAAQEKYIQELNTLAPFGYNISPTGGSQCSGGVSEETKLKMKKPKSEEHKLNLRKAAQDWHDNIGFSEDTKIKMSNARIGKKDSEETCLRKQKSMLGKNSGKVCSEQTKELLSLARKNKPSNFLGKKHSPETIETMRASRLGKPRGPYKVKNTSHTLQ